MAKVGNKWFLVVDGEEDKQYDSMVKRGEIVFDSPDSLHYLAGKGNEIYLVEGEMKCNEPAGKELNVDTDIHMDGYNGLTLRILGFKT